jgi:hypothetical protein
MLHAAATYRGPRRPWHGAGIVIAAGGARYFANAWVCVRMLRRWGCRLPVQFWYLGAREMTAEMKGLVDALDVTCVDAYEVRQRHPARLLGGYELKAYALYHSPFRHVLLLDADNVPLADPSLLFESSAYLDHGAVFWPDYGIETPLPTGRLVAEHPIWTVLRLVPGGPELESGQMCIDKGRCGRELRLALWMNEHSDFFNRYLWHDKDTFQFAWRMLDRPFTVVGERPVDIGGAAIGQRDFAGHILFQHRCGAKWTLDGANPTLAGFAEERVCLEYLEELRDRWKGRLTG